MLSRGKVENQNFATSEDARKGDFERGENSKTKSNSETRSSCLLRPSSKLISSKPFMKYIGKATTNSNLRFIKNYVTADPSPSPLLHQFRVKDKSKWVSDKNFN